MHLPTWMSVVCYVHFVCNAVVFFSFVKCLLPVCVFVWTCFLMQITMRIRSRPLKCIRLMETVSYSRCTVCVYWSTENRSKLHVCVLSLDFTNSWSVRALTADVFFYSSCCEKVEQDLWLKKTNLLRKGPKYAFAKLCFCFDLHQSPKTLKPPAWWCVWPKQLGPVEVWTTQYLWRHLVESGTKTNVTDSKKL